MIKFKQYILSLGSALILAGSYSVAYALPTDHYATNSVLADGKWVKFPVTSTGMQYISAATLRSMGFSDISKVNVYGTGGNMVPEVLTEDVPDDLPLLPSVKTSKGIIFFGTDHFSWAASTGSTPYAHTINPYSDNSYYFFSDKEIESDDIISKSTVKSLPQTHISSFTDRRIHEQELEGPDESGRQLLGEDFRSTKTRSFDFDLTGNTGNDVTMKINFSAKATGTSSLIFTANDTKLTSTNSDNIKAVSGTEFIVNGSSVKKASNIGEKLSLGITYSGSGTVSTARLDYIEVFYDRILKLDNGSLYFFTNQTEDVTADIDGCTANTQIWDVTNHSYPVEMNISLSGATASFCAPAGYHEYVAFEPDALTAKSVAWEAVANQDIHGLETPDMVIISPEEYLEGANRIATLHQETDGLNVVVLQPKYIYNEFSGGTPDVSAFRKLLKMWYDRSGDRSIKYCLLMGRPFYDNKVVSTAAKNLSYTPLPIWQSPTGTTESASYSTDAFLAMLDDYDAESFSMYSAKQRVAVGRLPVKSATEATQMAAKLEKYVKQPSLGAWRNKVMLIADDGNNGVHLEQSEEVYDALRSVDNGDSFLYNRVYLDSYPLEYTSVGASYPQAKERMLRNWDDGVIFTNYVGHASTTSWTHEKLLEWKDMLAYTNTKLTFLYAATCSFGQWDAPSVSGGELMVLSPTTGAIGMIVPSRSVYIYNNRILNRYMAKHVFKKDENGKPSKVGDIFIQGMNDYNDSNKLRYCLMSDPALSLPSPSMGIKINKINDVDVTNSQNDLPILEALSKATVEGVITDANGNVADDFNGTIDLLLYDAEKPITTYGNGDEGKVITYNDRKTKLTNSTVTVENGKWSAKLLLPSEIENNYSPALISAYAWSEEGEEANGYSDDFYVYGYNEEDNNDTEGPTIENFYLNNKNFSNGAVVNANPVVFASLYDESGINLSDAGIGHKIALALDGTKIYDDVNSYFATVTDREGAGSIMYPLEDIEPGVHTLTLSVWDNANNSSTASINFNVGAALDPVITDLSTDVNPASTSVVFSVTIDQPNTQVQATLDVFDLSGRKVWTSDESVTTDIQSNLTVQWDLCNKAGVRVPRGIYLYRATITTPEETYTSKTKKLAVTAQ